MCRRVATSDEVEYLALYIAKEAAGAQTEQSRHAPLHAQLLSHQRQPRQTLLGASDASSGLETDLRGCIH